MSICIECAMQHHDFQEIPILSRPTNGDGSGANLPEAWIDGKRHKLNGVGLYHVPCDDCRRVSNVLFVSKEG